MVMTLFLQTFYPGIRYNDDIQAIKHLQWPDYLLSDPLSKVDVNEGETSRP